MPTYFYKDLAGVKQGPASLEEVQRLAVERKIFPNSELIDSETNALVRAEEIKELSWIQEKEEYRPPRTAYDGNAMLWSDPVVGIGYMVISWVGFLGVLILGILIRSDTHGLVQLFPSYGQSPLMNEVLLTVQTLVATAVGVLVCNAKRGALIVALMILVARLAYFASNRGAPAAFILDGVVGVYCLFRIAYTPRPR